MEKLITHNINALRFLMNEDLYNLGDAVQVEKVLVVSELVAVEKESATIAVEKESEPVVVEKNVQGSVSEIAEEGLKEASFDYIGENNRYFLIIVDDNTHKNLNTPHKEMLMKIMAAKKLELRDIAILNLAQYPDSTFGQLKDFFSISKAALFGINPQRLGLPPMGANQPEKQLDVKVLATFGLEEMSANTDKKREFWNVMKDF
ncbi:MAG: hypothetical protein WBJ10_05020 [Daejeonella sp.]|uniref:hypothetical protein n=1 Tax=Daejeonella sp. TaxID=2805397 RepID=UPI003C77138F